MIIKPISAEAYKLLHDGSLALMDVEQNGIHIDRRYVKRTMRDIDKKILRLENRIGRTSEGKLWKEKFGRKLNLDSTDQLSDLLYKHLKIKPPKLTENSAPSVDAEAVQSLALPFIDRLIERRQLMKVKNTYLANIYREQVNGVLHPFFNLHLAKTYRSTSSNINFQNQPLRIPELAGYVRPAFMPTRGHRLGGLDYSGIEVCTSVCYHKDPNMIIYIKDKSTDMHRDTAMDLFILKKEQMTSDARFISKNDFVFAEFYGDYYVPISEELWKDIDKLKVTRADEMPLKEHLREQGIKTLSQFTAHVREVEEIFWGERFAVYSEWKDELWERYQVDGYYDTLTGFRISGPLRKNQVTNAPIQGSAFHCLLWSLIKINDQMKQLELRSKIVGQIHDEITQDNHEDEFDMVLSLSEQIMCKDILKKWDWIIVPLKVEAEFSGVDENWSMKKKVDIKPLIRKGRF